MCAGKSLTWGTMRGGILVSGKVNCWGALRLKGDPSLLSRTMQLNTQCLENPSFLGEIQVSCPSHMLVRTGLWSLLTEVQLCDQRDNCHVKVCTGTGVPLLRGLQKQLSLLLVPTLENSQCLPPPGMSHVSQTRATADLGPRLSSEAKSQGIITAIEILRHINKRRTPAQNPELLHQ